MLRFFLVGLFALFISPVVPADVIHFKNGDRITGVTRPSGDEALLIYPAFGGKLSVKMVEIVNIENEKDSVVPEPITEVSQVPEAIKEAVTPVEAASKFDWGSNISLNSSFSRGNTNSQLINLQGDLEIESGDHRYLLDISSIREDQEGSSIKEQDRLHLGYNYLYSEKWFFAVNTTTERDPISRLDHRISLNPSIGYEFWNEDNRTLNIQLGVGYASERTDGEDESSSLIDWRLKLAYKLLEGNMELFHDHHIYRNNEGRRNVVINTQTGVRYDISDDIYLNLQLNYDYDTDPVPGTDEEDLTFLVGAGVGF